MRVDEEIAMVTPVEPATATGPAENRGCKRRQPDRILNIVGIGESAAPSDIARALTAGWSSPRTNL